MGDDARVVVIGSGPSGAMAAVTLVEAGIPVTMLESGSARPRGALLRLNGRTVLRGSVGRADVSPYVAARGQPTTLLHLRAPGGLSNLWTGAVPRFAPEDFDEGSRLHERYRWPVSYRELVPYYERVERLLEIAGSRDDAVTLPAGPRPRYPVRLPQGWNGAARRARELHQDLIPVPLADGAPWMLAARATAFNSFDRLIAGLRGRSGFQLLLGAHAHRLEWSALERRVVSVSYIDRAGRAAERLRAAAVIVAAGPIESTRMLLDSTSAEFPDGLGDRHGILGRFLHDHPYDVSLVEFDRPVARLAHTLDLTRQPYATSEPLLAALATFGNPRMGLADRLLNLTPLRTRSLGLVVLGTVIPSAENRITLDPNQRDDLGISVPVLDVRFDDRAIRNVVAARDRAATVLEGLGRRCTVRPLVAVHVPGTSTHYGGSVRMHASPEHGMLDGWNRLHAVPNVLVTDASAFTTGPEKNPTLTAMALAARAAERLAKDLRRGQ